MGSNNAVNSDSKRHCSFDALHFTAGYSKHWVWETEYRYGSHTTARRGFFGGNMRVIAIGLLVLLTACASFKDMEKGLNALMHQDARKAFEVLGYPTTKNQYGDDTVYIWSINQSGAVVIPQTTTTTGYVGTTPVYGTTTTSQVVPVNHNCLIKLAAGPNGRLKNWQYRGNRGGCRPFIEQLRAYYRDAYDLTD